MCYLLQIGKGCCTFGQCGKLGCVVAFLCLRLHQVWFLKQLCSLFEECKQISGVWCALKVLFVHSYWKFYWWYNHAPPYLSLQVSGNIHDFTIHSADCLLDVFNAAKHLSLTYCISNIAHSIVDFEAHHSLGVFCLHQFSFMSPSFESNKLSASDPRISSFDVLIFSTTHVPIWCRSNKFLLFPFIPSQNSCLLHTQKI